MRTTSRRAALAAGLSLCALLAGLGTGQAEDFEHVRSDERSLRDLLRGGYTRSATFRSLVDRIDRLPCIVYVRHEARLPKHLEGALLLKPDGGHDVRILRVVLKPALAGDRAIAILAHELQHVLEAAGGDLRSARSMKARFGTLDRDALWGRTHDTEDACAVTERVLGELRAAR